jgi:ubiquinone/menaquinone biosynthesis C-methylase UbiE
MSGSAYHNRLEEFYDNKYRGAPGTSPCLPVRLVKFPADRFEMTVKTASINSGGRYLEVGAGSGRTVLAVLDYYSELVAMELSHERAQAMEKLFEAVPTKVSVICSDIESNDVAFPDDYFDTIVMTAVIEHLVDPIDVLKKLRRILKPAGRLILCTPNIGKWTRRIKLLFGYFPSTASLREGLLCYDRRTETVLLDEGHLHYFTFRSLISLCRQRAGFSAVEKFGFGKSLMSRAWPSLFSDVFIVAYK